MLLEKKNKGENFGKIWGKDLNIITVHFCTTLLLWYTVSCKQKSFVTLKVYPIRFFVGALPQAPLRQLPQISRLIPRFPVGW